MTSLIWTQEDDVMTQSEENIGCVWSGGAGQSSLPETSSRVGAR